MKSNEIEVEIRGPLSVVELKRLERFLKKHGQYKQDKNRVLIDYSTFLDGIEERERDVRLRITNGIPEIIVKIGKWGNNEARREISIKTEAGTFDNLVEFFGIIGISKGMLCVRNSKVYDYDGIEFALVEVPGHSFFYEAEILVDNIGDRDEAIKKIHKACNQLKIGIFTEEEFFQQIRTLNAEANEIFDYTSHNYEKNYFKNKFSL